MPLDSTNVAPPTGTSDALASSGVPVGTSVVVSGVPDEPEPEPPDAVQAASTPAAPTAPAAASTVRRPTAGPPALPVSAATAGAVFSVQQLQAWLASVCGEVGCSERLMAQPCQTGLIPKAWGGRASHPQADAVGCTRQRRIGDSVAGMLRHRGATSVEAT